MNRADRRKHHYIYRITRTDGSGKYYIGMHSADDLDDGYFGSGSLLSRSIKKHGKEKHIKEILEHLPTREALKLREKEIVNEELLGDKLCMNLQLGGGGGGGGGTTSEISKIVWQKPERRARQSELIKAQWCDVEFRKVTNAASSERMKQLHASGKVKYGTFAGKKHSEETLAKMRAARALYGPQG